jgi:hypothetical protein
MKTGNSPNFPGTAAAASDTQATQIVLPSCTPSLISSTSHQTRSAVAVSTKLRMIFVKLVDIRDVWNVLWLLRMFLS